MQDNNTKKIAVYLKETLSYSKFITAYPSQLGAFSIPQGMEDAFKSAEDLFNVVMDNVIRYADSTYFFGGLTANNYGQMTSQQYLYLEQGIQEWIHISVSNGAFKERIVQYQQKIDGGASYQTSSILVESKDKLVPSSVRAFFDLTGLRPQVSSYDMNTGLPSIDTQLEIPEWVFSDNLKKPNELRWDEKAQASDLLITDTNVATIKTENIDRDLKLAKLEDKTQNIDEVLTTSEKTVFTTKVESTQDIPFEQQGDLEYVNVKNLKRAESNATAALKTANESINTLNSLLQEVNAKNDIQDTQIENLVEEDIFLQAQIDGLQEVLKNVILFERKLDHSEDLANSPMVPVSTTTRRFIVPYKQTVVEGVSSIPHRIGNGDKIDIALSWSNGTKIEKYSEILTVGENAELTFTLGTTNVRIDSTKIYDQPNELTFIIEINNANPTSELNNIKLNQVVLVKAVAASNAITETQARALFALKNDSSKLGTTAGNGVSTDTITNITELWSILKKSDLDRSLISINKEIDLYNELKTNGVINGVYRINAKQLATSTFKTDKYVYMGEFQDPTTSALYVKLESVHMYDLNGIIIPLRQYLIASPSNANNPLTYEIQFANTARINFRNTSTITWTQAKIWDWIDKFITLLGGISFAKEFSYNLPNGHNAQLVSHTTTLTTFEVETKDASSTFYDFSSTSVFYAYILDEEKSFNKTITVSASKTSTSGKVLIVNAWDSLKYSGDLLNLRGLTQRAIYYIMQTFINGGATIKNPVFATWSTGGINVDSYMIDYISGTTMKGYVFNSSGKLQRVSTVLSSSSTSTTLTWIVEQTHLTQNDFTTQYEYSTMVVKSPTLTNANTSYYVDFPLTLWNDGWRLESNYSILSVQVVKTSTANTISQPWEIVNANSTYDSSIGGYFNVYISESSNNTTDYLQCQIHSTSSQTNAFYSARYGNNTYNNRQLSATIRIRRIRKYGWN